MKTIRLEVKNGMWYAKHENDVEIMSLFGTDTIPTPFVESAPVELVVDTIIKNYQGTDVTVWS